MPKPVVLRNFLESDIIGHLNDEFFIYVQKGIDVTNRAIMNIITSLLLNLNLSVQEPVPPSKQ
jgi:hypothetical protein